MHPQWISHLEGRTKELAQAIGLDLAIDFYAVYKHQRIWVSLDWSKNPQFLSLVGRDATIKITNLWGGQRDITINTREMERVLLADRIFSLVAQRPELNDSEMAFELKENRIYIMRLMNSYRSMAPYYCSEDLISPPESPPDRSFSQVSQSDRSTAVLTE